LLIAEFGPLWTIEEIGKDMVLGYDVEPFGEWLVQD